VLGDQKSVPENSEMKFLTMKPGSLVANWLARLIST